MLMKTRLQTLSSNLTNWFRSKVIEKKTMEEETFLPREQGDWLAERPASWYYGPLEFPPCFTQGLETDTSVGFTEQD